MGLWESEDVMVGAMPKMIAFLDTIRHMLEEISPKLGLRMWYLAPLWLTVKPKPTSLPNPLVAFSKQE